MGKIRDIRLKLCAYSSDEAHFIQSTVKLQLVHIHKLTKQTFKLLYVRSFIECWKINVGFSEQATGCRQRARATNTINRIKRKMWGIEKKRGFIFDFNRILQRIRKMKICIEYVLMVQLCTTFYSTQYRRANWCIKKLMS